MSLNMVYTNHMNDIQTYLSGKLPEVPQHIVQEIAAHISNRTMILVNDMIREYDRETKAAIRMRTWTHRETAAYKEQSNGK